MNGTPAGWYDDPEQPGQQRYWDGSAWTEHRAPGAETPAPPPAAPAAPMAPTPPPAAAPTPPPAAAPTTPPPVAPPVGAPTGAPLPPPSAPPATTSRKGLWIALSIIGVIVVLVIVAIVAVALLGDSKNVTGTIEKNLPAEIQSNFASQGLDVTVSKADCNKVANDDGPFTTTCQLTISGLSAPVSAEIVGTVSGSTVTLTDAKSDTVLLNESMAVKQTQPVVSAVASNVTVLSCSLAEPLVVVKEGLSFTCKTDSNETATFTVQGGKLVLTDVL
jgi:hypothetical protein